MDQLLKSNSKIHQRLVKLKTETWCIPHNEIYVLDLLSDFNAHLNYMFAL